MRRTLSSLLCLVALSGGVAEAQVTDVTLVPRGQLRLQFDPSFTSWNARFGERLENGALVTENEDLASDLTSETGASVFPVTTCSYLARPVLRILSRRPVPASPR